MKKMLILLSAILLFAGGCCANCKAEDLIDYVPADADGVVVVDAKRLIGLSNFKDLRKEDKDFNKNWLKFESELRKYGLKTDDLPSKLMMFFKADVGAKEAGVLAVTKITEAKLVDLLKAGGQDISYTVKTIAGRKAYVVAQKNKDADKGVVTYIKPNLVLVCAEDKAEKFFKAVGKAKNEKLIAADKKADRKALIYVLYVKAAKPVEAAKPAPEPAAPVSPMGGNPLDKVVSAFVALDLVGKEQKGVKLKAEFNCIDVQTASQMIMQLKFYAMIITMQFAQSPDLSKLVTEAIAIDQKDKNVKINISISESLLTKLKASVKARQSKALAGRSVPAAPAAPVTAK